MLILLTGLPGTGKSVVAQMLAEKTGGTIINSDTIRKKLFPEVRSYTPQETKKVIEETEKRVRDLLQEEKIVILDALFTKQNARDAYRALAEGFGKRFEIILVTAPEELVKQRIEARSHTEDASEATYATYLDRKQHFQSVAGTHFHVHNDASLVDLSVHVADIVQQLNL